MGISGKVYNVQIGMYVLGCEEKNLESQEDILGIRGYIRY